MKCQICQRIVTQDESDKADSINPGTGLTLCEACAVQPRGKSMTTIEFTDGILGNERMRVCCDLSRAESLVMVDYCVPGEQQKWNPTQYQCADACHTLKGLVAIGKNLVEQAVQEQGDCEWCEITL